MDTIHIIIGIQQCVHVYTLLGSEGAIGFKIMNIYELTSLVANMCVTKYAAVGNCFIITRNEGVCPVETKVRGEFSEGSKVMLNAEVSDQSRSCVSIKYFKEDIIR